MDGRSTFNIVWSCLSTTFICAWVSVHPNIPPPKYEEYGWRALARRLWLMFWTLTAPELILLWSFRQWKAAGEIARIYNERNNSDVEQEVDSKSSFFVAMGKGIISWFRGHLEAKALEGTAWTKTHGHFVVMGGIVLVQPEEEVESAEPPNKRKHREIIVDIAMFKELIKDPDFRINITEEELNDKAKGDFLSKSIAFLQVSWFIAQCIARFVQRLGVTELEVLTLALASVNGIMYFFWSTKPLGLQVPIRIKSMRKVDVDRDGYANGRILRELLPEFEAVEDVGGAIGIAFICLIFSPVLVPLAVFYMYVLLLAAMADVLATNTIPPDATHVPAFYSPMTESDELSLMVLLPIFGSIFGGLHCLAWNFTYPTQTERTLWRIASLSIAVTPTGFMILIMIYGTMVNFSRARREKWQGLWTLLELLLLAIIMLPIGFYVLARLVLLVEAFVLLRHQPADVFQTIDWIKFLPHV